MVTYHKLVQDSGIMISMISSKSRGYFDHGWLKTHHSFSFGDYYDPKKMGFGPLRVINEDFIEGGAGFPTHGHRDMEIITYVVKGIVAHKDSTGGIGQIRPGEIQKMTAGRGVKHSEYNGLKDGETHLYQIWIMPDKSGLSPAYEDRSFVNSLSTGNAVLLASPDGRDGSVVIHQNALIWARRMKSNTDWTIDLASNRLGWMQVVSGSITIQEKKTPGNTFATGDAAAIQDESKITIHASEDAEILFFDLIHLH